MSADADITTLFLCGDVMTGRGIDQVLPQPGSPRICERYAESALDYVALAEAANGPLPRPVDFSYIWGEALPELARRRPDLRIINLETSITRSEDCSDKGISYRMCPDNVPCLTTAGIDCCILANNHVLDWGRAGLVETLGCLDRAGITSAGAGCTEVEAIAPAVLQVAGDGRVLVFAYGSVTSGIPPDWSAAEDQPGVNVLRDLSEVQVERIARRIRACRRRSGDIVVVSLHWGGNWGYAVPAEQRRFAHALIREAEVNVVYGHSSHHPKGIEVYQGRPIFYGCGDFIDDYEGICGFEAYRDDLVVMYFVTLSRDSGELASCVMTPMQIRRFQLNRPSDRDAAWLCDMLNREGRRFGTSIKAESDGSWRLVWR
jgi:poly-gamma-glutamate capsule biosynthesis protein CapA/YwtB (metallophosphatase superfamily)